MFALIPKRLSKNLLACNIRLAHYSTLSGFSTFTSFVEKNEAANKDYDNSFTVSYLIESCGLSLQDAIAASRRVELRTPHGPNSVLAMLRQQCFSSTHISELVQKLPIVLLSNPKKTLLPKADFLQSIGISGNDLVRILLREPYILKRSLKNQLIPCYNFIKTIVKTDEMITRSLKRWPRIFKLNLKRQLIPNIALLRKFAVPESSVLLLVSQFPYAAMVKHEKFVETVEFLKIMGFDMQKSMFIHAIQALHALGKTSIEQKFETYAKWGWSDDEARSAFKRQPQCMVLYDKIIHRKMDFLVNRMGWSSKLIAKHPVVLGLSLDKRVMPRCSVFQVLVSRNLVKEDTSITTLLVSVDANFKARYVDRYLQTIPQLMDVYQGKKKASTLMKKKSAPGKTRN